MKEMIEDLKRLTLEDWAAFAACVGFMAELYVCVWIFG